MKHAYWRKVGMRAWAETARLLHIETFGQIMLKGLIGVGVLLALIYVGSPGAGSDEFTARLVTALIVVFLIPLVFAANLVSSIKSHDAEQVANHEIQLRHLEAELNSAKFDEGRSAKDRLRSFFEEVNPDILMLIDARQSQFTVQLSSDHASQLNAMMRNILTQRYISLHNTHGFILGEACGDGICDLDTTGPRGVYVVTVKDLELNPKPSYSTTGGYFTIT